MAGKGMQIRGGNRGGWDQFDWEDVKVDKYRENYLGHSLKASVGRWQKGKDLTWYTKGSKVAGRSEKIKAEVAAIKKAEEEAMAAALGLKPPAPVKPQQLLTQQEMAEVCRRRSQDEADEGGEERMKGVGFQSRRAQVMFMGSKSTTTKEGATVFEHDSEVKDDGRLKMPESKRRSLGSVSDVATPTASTSAPVNPADLNTPTTTTTITLTKPMETKPAVSPTSEAKKTKKKKKKVKKQKEKKRKHRRRDDSGSSSGYDSEVKRVVKKGKLKKKRKRERSSSSSSGEAEWAEKQLPDHHKRHPQHSKSPRRRSNSPRQRSRSPRQRSRSPHRRSRSPRRQPKYSHRRSRSPRRRSRSPRRRSRSPHQRSMSPPPRSKAGNKRSGHRSRSSSSSSSSGHDYSRRHFYNRTRY